LASRRRLSALGLAFALVASPVSADEPSAEDLKARGNRAMMDLDYSEALASYRASLEKNPTDVALHYNIGRAHQARGDYPSALDSLLEFERTASPETRAKVPSLAALIADIRSHVGEIAFRCTPEAADAGVVVVTDGGGPELARASGCAKSLTKLRLSLPTKRASVEVRLQSERVSSAPARRVVEGGTPTTDVIFAVTPKRSGGLVRVLAQPASAVVSVDGAPQGNSPVEIVLDPGSHAIDVSADGWEASHMPIVVETGSTKELNVMLEKTPPITKRWWFWAGAGAATAGIITLVVILVAQPERSASKGTIEPGVIRAPLVTF
jgi:hypothetical protein